MPTWMQTLLIVLAALTLARSRESEPSAERSVPKATTDTTLLASAWNRYNAMRSAVESSKDAIREANDRLSLVVLACVGLLAVVAGDKPEMGALGVPLVLALYGRLIPAQDRRDAALSLTQASYDQELSALAHLVGEMRDDYEANDAIRTRKDRFVNLSLATLALVAVGLVLAATVGYAARLW